MLTGGDKKNGYCRILTFSIIVVMLWAFFTKNLSRAERINELLSERKIQVATSGSQVPVDMVQHFAVNPYFTINKMAEKLRIAYSTVQRGVQKLEAAGIIKKTNGNKRDKVYCATAILSILEEPTKIKADVYE